MCAWIARRTKYRPTATPFNGPVTDGGDARKRLPLFGYALEIRMESEWFIMSRYKGSRPHAVGLWDKDSFVVACATICFVDVTWIWDGVSDSYHFLHCIDFTVFAPMSAMVQCEMCRCGLLTAVKDLPALPPATSSPSGTAIITTVSAGSRLKDAPCVCA